MKAFGKAETRQLIDIRCSANLKIALGGAAREERAKRLANTLDRNKALSRPTAPTVALAQGGQAARGVILARETMRRS